MVSQFLILPQRLENYSVAILCYQKMINNFLIFKTTKMIITTLKENVTALNNMILEGKILDAFDQFYADNVTMQENENPATIGKAACKVNEEAFVNGITAFRNATVKNILVSDNITATEWQFDFTHKDWGVRNYTQLSVQRWNNEGKIINEHFYYNN
jgi:hypothetical protein